MLCFLIIVHCFLSMMWFGSLSADQEDIFRISNLKVISHRAVYLYHHLTLLLHCGNVIRRIFLSICIVLNFL